VFVRNEEEVTLPQDTAVESANESKPTASTRDRLSVSLSPRDRKRLEELAQTPTFRTTTSFDRALAVDHYLRRNLRRGQGPH